MSSIFHLRMLNLILFRLKENEAPRFFFYFPQVLSVSHYLSIELVWLGFPESKLWK